jgi:hypothetical protein
VRAAGRWSDTVDRAFAWGYTGWVALCLTIALPAIVRAGERTFTATIGATVVVAVLIGSAVAILRPKPQIALPSVVVIVCALLVRAVCDPGLAQTGDEWWGFSPRWFVPVY